MIFFFFIFFLNQHKGVGIWSDDPKCFRKTKGKRFDEKLYWEIVSRIKLLFRDCCRKDPLKSTYSGWTKNDICSHHLDIYARLVLCARLNYWNYKWLYSTTEFILGQTVSSDYWILFLDDTAAKIWQLLFRIDIRLHISVTAVTKDWNPCEKTKKLTNSRIPLRQQLSL